MMPLWTRAILPALVEVWMGVTLAGGAVSGPAGVSDAYGRGRALRGQFFLELHDSADGSRNVDPVAFKQGYPSGVISAVFQPFEALDEDRARLFVSDITDNSAHETPLLGAFHGSIGDPSRIWANVVSTSQGLRFISRQVIGPRRLSGVVSLNYSAARSNT